MHSYIFFVIYIIFAPVMSTSCVNNSNDIKFSMKVIKTETFYVALHQNKSI